ncbi:MAG TPA: hypothetical protein VGR91_09115 [Stellaceae bacterium]|nr:hypothetical protein [Stellaceae bacterium]
MTRRKFPKILRRSEHSAEVDAYIRNQGVTRCPTACVTQTTASPTAADRAALERHAAWRERLRRERLAATRIRSEDLLRASLFPEEER